MPSVTTWADGFGRWHARVTERGVGDSALALETARAAIVEELEQREGASFDPDSVRVELVSRTSQWGELTSHFREAEVELVLSDPVPANRVPYRDDTVWEAVGFPGPVLHGYRDVKYHEAWRASQGLGPGEYRQLLEPGAGPCAVAVCSSDGRYHYCREYGAWS